MKQSMILLFLMIFTISIFSVGPSFHTVNATDQPSSSLELCQNNNSDSIYCDKSTIDETSPSYFSLMLIKEVIGGPASSDDFFLTVNGNPVQSGYENFYSAGDELTIDETQIPDYIFSSITGEGCPTQLNEPFTLTQDTICIITNIHCLVPPYSLTIYKEVIGGPASSNDFALTVDDSPRNSGQVSFHPVNTMLSIDETQQPDYIFSSITGDGCPTNLDEFFMLTKDTVCTITNIFNPNPADITVIKTIINDDGGLLTIAGVDLKLDGTSVTNGTANTVSPGAHTVSETAIPGYNATIGGDCDESGSITVTEGESYTCTITNDDNGLASLKVIKKVDGGLALPNDFELTVNGTSVLSGLENYFPVNSILSINEKNQTGYFFSFIDGEDCPPKPGKLFTLSKDLECTITNTFGDPVSLTVNIEIFGGEFSLDDFNLTVDGHSVESGQKTLHLVNSTLSINETQKPEFVSSITGEGCPKSLKQLFSLTTDTICTIIINVVTPPQGDPGGHEEWDTRPTFGLSHETRETQMVDWGFVFNDQAFKITDNFHTPFDAQTIEIGKINTFVATVWADKGLKVQEFLFGIPNVGDGHLAELRVEVWFDTDNKIDNVKIIQEDPVIDISRLTVSHEKSKCLEKDENEKCDSTKIFPVFLEHLRYNVTAIKAIDFKLRDQTTYLNEGFGISGNSLNPMKTMEIPSNKKGEGLITVTQIEKYSPYWISDDGRVFEKNNSDSFKQIGMNFERFPDAGTAYTRQHSEFGKVIEYEQKRALNLFNATEFVSKLPDSFSYNISIKERITDEVIAQMTLQSKIAQEFLEKNNVQARW